MEQPSVGVWEARNLTSFKMELAKGLFVYTQNTTAAQLQHFSVNATYADGSDFPIGVINPTPLRSSSCADRRILPST